MPAPADENFLDLYFPGHGLDVSTEFGRQPPDTTPLGQNVRLYEPATNRARGAARPGLSKYVPPQLPTGTHLIQLLDYVVNTDELALNTGSDPLDTSGGIADPSTNNGPVVRNPGRFVRNGGSGIRLNRHVFTGPKLTPKVTPKNQTKSQGTLFNFLGTEFTQTGLLPGDAYLTATITSAGQVASAAPGNYQIGIANPVPNSSLALHQSQNRYNPTVLGFGTLTVSPNSPIAINLRIEGGHSNLDFRSLPQSVPPGPYVGYKAWRVMQYLIATGFPTRNSPASGGVDPSGVLQGGPPNPIPNLYAAVAGVPAVDYQTVIRFEVSPDGTTWPSPPLGF